jgi:hypothetical protein
MHKIRIWKSSLDNNSIKGILAKIRLPLVFLCIPSAAVLYYAGLYYDISDLNLLAYLFGIIGTINLYLHTRDKRKD